MKMRGRLLFVVSNTDSFISHRLPLAEAAQADGWEVHVAANPATVPHDHAARQQIEESRFPFHAIQLGRGAASLLQNARGFAELLRLYRRLRPTLVHQVTIKPVVFGTLAARLSGVPAVVNAVAGLGFVWLDPSLRGRLRRGVIEVVYRVALTHPNCRVIFQNDDDVRWFRRARIVRDPQIRMIRGSGVDLGHFPFSAEVESLAPLVVLPARMLRDKGVLEFVEAAERLAARGVSARWALVGDSDANPASLTRDELRAIHARGIVEWWGHRSDMPTVYAEAAVVCLPSYREGLPKVLLEAASCGRAIITTDVPGCRDAILPCETADLVPVRDVEALEHALEALLTDAPRRQRYGARGRVFVESAHGIERVQAATLEVYQDLVASTGGSVV